LKYERRPEPSGRLFFFQGLEKTVEKVPTLGKTLIHGGKYPYIRKNGYKGYG